MQTGNTVIVGFAEALSAPEVTWSLIDGGFEVIAFSRRGRRSSLANSRFARVVEITAPELDLARAIEELTRAVRQIANTSKGRCALMALDDEALLLCARIERPDNVLTVGPAASGVDIALDKARQMELARNAGFRVPATVLVSTRADLVGLTINFPVVFKPAKVAFLDGGAVRRQRAWICADQAELNSAVNLWQETVPMLLQEYLYGVGEGIFGLATADGVTAWSAHRRLRMMNPNGSGSCACVAVDRVDEECKAAGERFLQATGWRGLFMFELLRDAAGSLWFVELNGRAWGSMALARRAGFEYPAWAVQLAIDPAARPSLPAPVPKAVLCRHLGREILHLLFVIRGPRSKAIRNWPSIPRTLLHLVSVRPNDFWYNWRRDDPKVFFSDCYVTLANQMLHRD